MKIISGGQTGVDRAALDSAREAGLSLGGWCPRGGRAEDKTRLLEKYPELQETPERDYRQRTRWNVRDADATLIFHRGNITPGTGLTIHLARDSDKPWMLVDLEDPKILPKVRGWLESEKPAVLNIAGPRESSAPGVYDQTRELLRELLEDNS